MRFTSVGERHRDHHRRNEGQGCCGSFRLCFGQLCGDGNHVFYSLRQGIGWFWGLLLHFQPMLISYSMKTRLSAENAGALCASQIRHVASQLWSSCRLVGSCFGTYKPVEWLTEEEANSRGVIGNSGGGKTS